MWINLLHAVPGRFNLADLPTSPPSTPGMPVRGEDYFTSKVFDNAVPAVDYESELTPARPHTHPLAAPATINLAIVERYIPPTSVNELADLYNPYGSSMLMDRLVELTPSDGCLTFIYPTRTGGNTFVSQHLGPILDPILRTMVIMHGLSRDFSSALGPMDAVKYLQNFSWMRDKMSALCHQLNSKREGIVDKLHHPQGTFSMAYAAAHDISIDRKVWAEWWVKQEKARIRASVSRYFRTTHRIQMNRHGQPDVQQASLIQELFDGVQSKPVPTVSDQPIEVAVFVIRRQQ